MYPRISSRALITDRHRRTYQPADLFADLTLDSLGLLLHGGLEVADSHALLNVLPQKRFNAAEPLILLELERERKERGQDWQGLTLDFVNVGLRAAETSGITGMDWIKYGNG